MKKKIRYILGWIFIRPIRWFFWKMVSNCYLRPKFEKDWDKKIRWPNYHWWILYKTVYNFFKWLDWDAWRYFCKWEKNGRKTYPFVARMIHKVGQTTAGGAQYGGSQCYHCASSEGDPVYLSDDETGETFILESTWSSSTECGTDYRFSGYTICPKCGYKDYYEDGSL